MMVRSAFNSDSPCFALPFTGGQCWLLESQLALLSIMMITFGEDPLAAELVNRSMSSAPAGTHKAAIAAAATERFKKVVFFKWPPERGSCYRQELARSVALI